MLRLPKQEHRRISQGSQAAGSCKQMCSKLMGFGSQCYHHTGSCLPSLCLSPSRIKALAKAQRSSPVPPSPAAPSPATSFIFHTQPSRTETLVRNFTEAPERCFLSFFSAEEGRGVTAQGEGFVEFARGFFFFLFPFFATLVVQGSVLCYSC